MTDLDARRVALDHSSHEDQEQRLGKPLEDPVALRCDGNAVRAQDSVALANRSEHEHQCIASVGEPTGVFSHASMFEQIETGNPAALRAFAIASTRGDLVPSSSPIVVGCSLAGTIR